ncbi:hypothetical protein FE391_07095 [Nonomuraea sp. KC401]|uniref:hypothetical protein n=1 Tax=unclassified Nonomuraea TaxID=2593643 RepID=UPI0010FD0DC1|nr:hypothetical protein [Nonomuraea sp. KC401]NBE93811.1 hypothetical protein [Nonomuraea sp. K271]TLF80683.1 hypothetical protein FE391_07095 [Nonomuraea sp. KC401]
MKIVALETVRPAVQPNLLFVRLHTDTGLTGLGEAFFGARTVEAYLHESVAPVLLTASSRRAASPATVYGCARATWPRSGTSPACDRDLLRRAARR